MKSIATTDLPLDILIQNKTDAYGTVRPNRRDTPPAFKTVKLAKGEMKAWQKGKIIALKWKEKKDVCFMSTVHDASKSTVMTRGGKEVEKPNLVLVHTSGIPASSP